MMRNWIFALLAAFALITSGCASSGGASSTTAAVADSGDLPEIAAYDDEAFEALPDMVPAGE
ncbi:MAG TPA: hypothetical protein PL131_07385 [Methylotenera sp.]|nr:hypothetical protein [Methylotenera sp.]HPH05683.1 hypothetical protein [Methylotenera sp.]HPN01363.1 hypothetical protein [Methylotenera sp.]